MLARCGKYRKAEARDAMRTWLGRMPWALVWLLFVGTVFAAPPSAGQIRCWIRQLDSHDFAVCAEASRNLTDAGELAIEALLASAGQADAEAAWRTTGVLEQIALHGSDGTLRQVTAGLEELARHGKPGFDGIIGQLQTRQARLQRERAVAMIRSLGGRFEADEQAKAQPVAKSAPGVGGNQAVLAPPPEVALEQGASATGLSIAPGIGLIGDAYVSPEFLDGTEPMESLSALTIDEHWRGGDAGLAALLDLGSTLKLRLERAPLSDAALERLAAITQLQSLELVDCRFSTRALDRLRERQPRTQIIVHGK
jgi:hypothetical protein